MALISWIEKDGEIFYITDWDYVSSRWVKRMVGLRDSDPLGHGAIHRFYDFSGGRSYTQREFWKPNIPLPLELSKKLCADKFDRYFKFLLVCSNTSDLVQMVILAPQWLGRKALEVLSDRKGQIDSDTLRYLFENTFYNPDVKAWRIREFG